MARVQRPSSAGSRFLSPAVPRVFAHRGLAVGAPENTLLAFEKAVAAGATYVETDVHASRDGIAVVSHDSDLSRLAGQAVQVHELTLAELRRVDLGEGQGFCSLADALEAFPETRFNIDVKAYSAVVPTIRAVSDAGAIDRVLITSFSERRRSASVRGLAGVATSASAPRFVLALAAAKLGLAPVVRLALRGIVALQVPESALGLHVTSPRMLARFHNAGVEVHIWTVNDPSRMRQLLLLGVDGIITDRADLALQVVETFNIEPH